MFRNLKSPPGILANCPVRIFVVGVVTDYCFAWNEI